MGFNKKAVSDLLTAFKNKGIVPIVYSLKSSAYFGSSAL